MSYVKPALSNSPSSHPKDYDIYLFDWDGTLGKTLEMWLDLIRSEFANIGIVLTDSEVVETFGRLGPAAHGYGVHGKQFESFMDTVRDKAETLSASVELYPGAFEMLERLKTANKQLALITTNWRVVADVMLKNHQLEHMFDVVITGNDVKERKPDPEGILFTLNKLDPQRKLKAVMLGDSPHDLGAAQNAEIDSILYYPPDHQLFYDIRKLEKYEPAAVIDDWSKFRLT